MVKYKMVELDKVKYEKLKLEKLIVRKLSMSRLIKNGQNKKVIASFFNCYIVGSVIKSLSAFVEKLGFWKHTYI